MAIKKSTLAHIEYLLSVMADPSDILVPIVRFDQPGAPLFYAVAQETWRIEGFNDQTLATRCQIPLILAWALSIHKSQGQTIKCLPAMLCLCQVSFTWHCQEALILKNQVIIHRFPKTNEACAF